MSRKPDENIKLSEVEQSCLDYIIGQEQNNFTGRGIAVSEASDHIYRKHDAASRAQSYEIVLTLVDKGLLSPFHFGKKQLLRVGVTEKGWKIYQDIGGERDCPPILRQEPLEQDALERLQILSNPSKYPTLRTHPLSYTTVEKVLVGRMAVNDPAIKAILKDLFPDVGRAK